MNKKVDQIFHLSAGHHSYQFRTHSRLFQGMQTRWFSFTNHALQGHRQAVPKLVPIFPKHSQKGCPHYELHMMDIKSAWSPSAKFISKASSRRVEGQHAVRAFL